MHKCCACTFQWKAAWLALNPVSDLGRRCAVRAGMEYSSVFFEVFSIK